MVKRREREDPMYLLAEGGEEERWKTAEDLPGEKTYVDLLAREIGGRPRRIFQGRRPL